MRPTRARAGQPLALVQLERPQGACLTVRRLVILEGIFCSHGKLRDRSRLFLLFFSTVVMIGNLSVRESLPFQISIPGIAVSVVVVVLGAALATLALAFRASRLNRS